MIRVKQAVVCGYEHAGEICAIALKQADAKVVVFEVDSHLTIQAKLRGFSVVTTLDDVVPKADILVISGNNMDNIAAAKLHFKKMKNNAIIYVDSVLLDHSHANKRVFPDTNSSIFVFRKKEYPGLALSRSRTRPVVAMLELRSKRGRGEYERKVYGMPDHLEEKVSALHLAQLAAAEETTAQDGQYSVPIDNQGDVLVKTAEPKISRTTRMLLMTVQACSLLGIIALGLSKASKIKVELSLCAIWGN
ncbi:adenosylhomocysteinase-like [Neltuma alba]|uniref:adenosylhomocysteinase-like n=1 Tax=Neltuma alba TaxID=207710 RepID=UPI0010A4B388|nr:adenosylhomocysteinase-like [Prosopis alba]